MKKVSYNRFNNQKVALKKQILICLMFNGQKGKCYNVFKKTIKSIQKNTKKNCQEIIKLSLLNSLPIIYGKTLTKKKGKQRFIQKIPFILSKNQRIKLSIKYILSTLKEKALYQISRKLQNKFILCSKSYLHKKKDSLNHEYLSVKKYVKFRWFL